MDPHANGLVDQGTLVNSSLIAGEFPRTTVKGTILTGASYTEGAVMGKITASGKFTLSASAAADGSQTPTAILAHDVDATSADQEAIFYLTGEFNPDALTLGTGHTAASIRAGLRDLSIFI